MIFSVSYCAVAFDLTILYFVVINLVLFVWLTSVVHISLTFLTVRLWRGAYSMPCLFCYYDVDVFISFLHFHLCRWWWRRGSLTFGKPLPTISLICRGPPWWRLGISLLLTISSLFISSVMTHCAVVILALLWRVCGGDSEPIPVILTSTIDVLCLFTTSTWRDIVSFLTAARDVAIRWPSALAQTTCDIQLPWHSVRLTQCYNRHSHLWLLDARLAVWRILAFHDWRPCGW